MPIPSDQVTVLEQNINRLASEAVMAMAGRDEGLVPAYSLLGDIADICALDDILRPVVSGVRNRLEEKLDRAEPFDAPTLGELRQVAEWLANNCDALRSGNSMSPWPKAGAPASADVAPSAEAAAPLTADQAAAAAAAATEPAQGEEVLMVLNLEENRDLLVEFYGETAEHLQQIESTLLRLEEHPEDPEALSALFRSFHTIKGNAGFLQLLPMHTLAHEVESLLDLARNRKLTLNSTIITEILRSRDALQALAQQVSCALETGQLPKEIVPVGPLIVAVMRLASGASEAAAAPAPAAHPAVSSASPAMTADSFTSPVAASVPLAPAAPAASSPVASTPAAAAVAAPVNVPVPTTQGASGAAQAGSATVRVNTEKLDSLMDLVGELVIVRSQIIESAREHGDASSPLHRNVGQLNRIAKELQHNAMSLRMIPIKPTFQKMERLVRDLAKNLDKKVAFHTEGEDTELDRTVVEEIADPLVHMVRNAVDHGLETTAKRLAAGKSETGTVTLRAYHQGGHIVIELEDDGGGIDPDKIFRKAVDKGIISANAQMSRDEILALIFAAGFSTAEKVTSVSGRGVGMDVVRRNIEKLRGKVEISSEVGRGSVFKVKLPLTMAIIDGLVVSVGDDRFIIPSTSVQMALRPQRENIVTLQGRGEALELRGRILPLHRLYARFGITAKAPNPWEGIVLIVETSGSVYALLVDEMLSKQEVVIKSLGAYLQNLAGVSGGAILGDGNIALILDPASLLKSA